MLLSCVRALIRPSRTSPARASRKPCRPRLEELEVREVLSAATDAFVNGVYHALLHRAVDAVGRVGWGSLLDSGQLSRAQVVQGIENSDEYQNTLVNDAYLQILGRPVDPAGLIFWRSILDRDDGPLGPLDEFRAGLFASQEFFLKAGGTTAEFLNQLYGIALGRQPDAPGLAAFTAVVNGNDLGQRTAAARVFVGSLEADVNQMVNFYRGILGREPDALGFNFWVGVLQSGASALEVAADFLSSPEFFNLITTNPNFTPDATLGSKPMGMTMGPEMNTPPPTGLQAPACGQGSFIDAEATSPANGMTLSIQGSSGTFTRPAALETVVGTFSFTVTAVSADGMAFTAKSPMGVRDDTTGQTLATGLTLNFTCLANGELQVAIDDQNNQPIGNTAVVVNLVHQ